MFLAVHVSVRLVGALAMSASLLTFESLAARAPAGVAELRAEVEIAAARRAVAATAGLREAPVIGLAGGPRNAEGETDVDVALELELALLRRGPEREELASALRDTEAAMRSAARAATRRQLNDAFVAAWAAAERVRLRERDVALVARWLDLARRRVEAGADPPFEAELVAAQHASARLGLARARADAAAARAELAALVASKPDDTLGDGELAPPPEPTAAAPDGVERGATLAAVRARVRLGAALARLGAAGERSRWSIVSDVEREGDETAAHLGFALRLPRREEDGAVVAEVEAEVAALAREAGLEEASLRARGVAAAALVRELADEASAPDVEGVLRALDARLVEGKDRPIEALPLRREVWNQIEEALERRVTLYESAAELEELTTEVSP